MGRVRDPGGRDKKDGLQIRVWPRNTTQTLKHENWTNGDFSIENHVCVDL